MGPVRSNDGRQKYRIRSVRDMRENLVLGLHAQSWYLSAFNRADFLRKFQRIFYHKKERGCDYVDACIGK